MKTKQFKYDSGERLRVVGVTGGHNQEIGSIVEVTQHAISSTTENYKFVNKEGKTRYIDEFELEPVEDVSSLSML